MQVVLIDDFMHLDALLLFLMVCCVFRAHDATCIYKVTNQLQCNITDLMA